MELGLTDDKPSLDDAAASSVCETLSGFFRPTARARADEVLADERDIVLSGEDAARFLDALETPAATVARLRDRACAPSSSARTPSTQPDDFDCGNESLNRRLTSYTGHSERSDAVSHVSDQQTHTASCPAIARSYPPAAPRGRDAANAPEAVHPLSDSRSPRPTPSP